MPVFNYTALNIRTGQSVAGAMEVPDEAALDAKLTGMGFSLTNSVKQKPKKKLFDKISRRDLIDFYYLMTYQVRAGVSVIEAVRVAGGECKHPRLRDILKAVERKAKSGLMFFEAMEGHPEAFPPNVVNMVRAGEMSCKLHDTFRELREYEEWQEKMQADIRQATIYPTVVVIVIAAFVLVLSVVVIPKFKMLLSQLKTDLPLCTEIVFNTSDFFRTTWWLWILLAIAFKFGLTWARKRYDWVAFAYDRISLMIPGFGTLNLMISMSRLTHNLGSLTAAGLTVLDALHHTRELVGNKVVERAVRRVKADVTAGVDLSEALAKHPVFPEMVIRMVSLGETTGFLEDALENASEFYNQVIPRTTKKLFSLLEPVLMLFIVGMMGLIAASIFLPLVQMMGGAGLRNL